MRKNGIISSPQRLVDAVAPYAYGALANSKGWRKYTRTLKRGSPGQRELAREIEKDARWFKRKGLSTARGIYSAKIKTDLSDLGKTYPREKMEELNPHIDLKIHTTISREELRSAPLAAFDSGLMDRRTGVVTRINRIKLFLPLIASAANRGGGPPVTLGGYKRIKQQTRDAIDHEFRHFTQNALLDVLSGKKKWPNRQSYETALNEIGLEAFDRPAKPDYLLQKVEYFPWIGDIFSEVRRRADSENRYAEKQGEKPFLLTSDTFDQFSLDDSPMGGDFTQFVKDLRLHSPDRFQRYLVEKTAFINDYNEAVLTRRQQRRYLTPQRVVSEVLLDLDIEDRGLAAWLRQNREWAEETAQEAL
jgi:hypothetical protein